LKHLSGTAATVLSQASCPCLVPSLLNRSLSAAARALDTAILGEIRTLIGQAKLEHLLDLLADELEERPRALRDALADRQFDQASAAAHTLKGAAGNLGATAVADAARLLQPAIAHAQEGCLEALAPALRHLARAVSDAQQALTAMPRAQEAALAT
jgi:HPt (histidine-containing phosphotransfer) domain-containing protein